MPLQYLQGKSKKIVKGLLENPLVQAVSDNPLAVTVGTIGTAAGLLSIGSAVSTVFSSVPRRRRSPSKRLRSGRTRQAGTRRLTKRQRYIRKIKRRPGRQTPYTAGGRRDRSRTRVRYTKHGQPYKLDGKGGRARFIKKTKRR